MSLQTTPLQFGYFLGLLFAVLFWLRGYKEERLSDTLLGFIMFFLAMEIQDYTFGFAGINILWATFEGLPRHFPWVFPATVYFYIQSQTNSDFKFTKKHFLHFLPYVFYVLGSIFLFLIDKKHVDSIYNSPLGFVVYWYELIVMWLGILFYFSKSIGFYSKFRAWTLTQYSDLEAISFEWIRNFIFGFVIGASLRFIFLVIDAIFDLPYERDFYWQLFTVCMIAYVGIRGYSQFQPRKIKFVDEIEPIIEEKEEPKPQQEQPDYSLLISKIDKLFKDEKIFLQSELNLSELASKLKTNSSVLSAIINQHYHKNFNDFVNDFRVEEFKFQIKLPENKAYTLLSVALDCGFNSKATFNRAFKKHTGMAPKTYL
jgi:AraC-like DNA-binding protein